MRTLIIGGAGHIGGFLTPMLRDDGHEVVVISTGRTRANIPDRVRLVAMQYPNALHDGSFASLLRETSADVVVDILQDDITGVYSNCRDAGVRQVIMCGSLWMYGAPKTVPTPESTQSPCGFEGYKRRYAEMLDTIEQTKNHPISVCAIMPPNICGPGKIPADGMGGRSLELHKAHRRGDPVILPFPGTNLIGPCDAEDVARGFLCAIRNSEASRGEIFNVGSAYALTVEKFIQTYAEIHKTRIPIDYVSAETYITDISPDPGAHYHFIQHMCPDISKISRLLKYTPRYTPEQTMERAVKWMYDEGLFK